MQNNTFSAQYLIETPLSGERVAEVMAGEQSCGTFIRVQGETNELRARARATVKSVQLLGQYDYPSLPNAFLERKNNAGPWQRYRVIIDFPIDNIGVNLATLAATVAGNLYDLGELTGLRLERIDLPAEYRLQYDMPKFGVVGTRKITGVDNGPLIGTIIKPNVGLSAEQTAQLVKQLCDAGVDFIKDDEICANPVYAPLSERVPAVMSVIKDHQQRTGKHVMMAFNISDDLMLCVSMLI